MVRKPNKRFMSSPSTAKPKKRPNSYAWGANSKSNRTTEIEMSKIHFPTLQRTIDQCWLYARVGSVRTMSWPDPGNSRGRKTVV
jgi:hypothetical protein